MAPPSEEQHAVTTVLTYVDAEIAALETQLSKLALLLPQDVNRSLRDKPYEEKVEVYSGQNLYPASFSKVPYAYRSQFKAFREAHELELKPLAAFKKKQVEERCGVLVQLADAIWSPEGLDELR